MNRRTFVATLSGLPAAGFAQRYVRLQAVVAAELPAALYLPAAALPSATAAIVELRTYRGARPGLEPALRRIFARAGLTAFLHQRDPELTWLIPFHSLAARERWWNLVNAGPEWPTLRERFDSYQFSLYRDSA